MASMSKSVLDTINEYSRDPHNRESLETHAIEIELCDLMIEMRRQAGLTQEDLARRVGFSQAYIAKLENGAYDRAGIGTLRRFALALGHDINIGAMFKPIANVWPSYPWNAIRLIFPRNERLTDEPLAAHLEERKEELCGEGIAA